MRMLLLSVALLVPMRAVAGTITVETFCLPWSQMSELVAQRHELPVSRGQISQGTMLLITASPGGATFSVFGMDDDGNACLIDYGEGWKPGQNPEEDKGQ